MPSNKDRLYVVLYVRGGNATMPGGEDEYASNPLELMVAKINRYHWSLLVGPKKDNETSRGMRYHANERIVDQNHSQWFFEERETSMKATSMLLIRVLVGKVESTSRLVEILRHVPIKGGEPGWNCVAWVKEALEVLSTEGKVIGTGVLEWKKIRDTCMAYVQKKRDQHRFDGTRNFNMDDPPTFDLLENKEVIK